MLVSHSITQDTPLSLVPKPLQQLYFRASPKIVLTSKFQQNHKNTNTVSDYYSLLSIFFFLSCIGCYCQHANKNKQHMSRMDEKTSHSLKQNSGRKATRNRHVRSCMFRIPWHSEFSPAELVKDLAERVTNALRLAPLRRSLHNDSASLGRSKSAVSSVDSHRTAAVEDCIEFIHSSFSRSNSLTTTSREDSIDAP